MTDDGRDVAEAIRDALLDLDKRAYAHGRLSTVTSVRGNKGIREARVKESHARAMSLIACALADEKATGAVEALRGVQCIDGLRSPTCYERRGTWPLNDDWCSRCTQLDAAEAKKRQTAAALKEAMG